MSEQQTAEVAPEAADSEAAGEVFDPERAAAKIRKANDEAKSLRARLKELEPIAAEAQKLRDAQKTEAERLAERLQAATSQTEELDHLLKRYRVALRYGLSESDIEDLNWSGTDEEIQARVERYLEKAAATGRKQPVTDVGQGVRTAPALNGDPLLNSLKSTLGIA